jgi:tetratricopeptide (TPR) repeat protein
MNILKNILIAILITYVMSSPSYGSDLPNILKEDGEPSPGFLQCVDLYKNKRAPDSLACFSDFIKAPGTTVTEKDLSYRVVSKISIATDGDTKFSQDILVHAIQEIPNSPDLYFTLCDVLYLRSDYVKAINVCSKGLVMMGGIKTWHNDLHLRAFATIGDSYLKLKKYDKADEAYRALLDSKLSEFRDIGKQRLDHLNQIRIEQK